MFQKKAVRVAVADIRKEPFSYNGSSKMREKDLFQETQALYGDIVLVHEERGDWSFVTIQDQHHSHPQGYPGWIQSEYLAAVPSITTNAYITAKWTDVILQGGKKLSLSMGTKIAVKPHENPSLLILQLLDGRVGEIEACNVRKRGLIELGLEHVGDPYFWGGYSAYNPNHLSVCTGVDCSSLVHLLYRCQGTILPRNASDQFSKVSLVQGKDLVPGDLIFLKSQNKIYHVMLYVGSDLILEATMLSNSVRLISSDERLGAPIATLLSGYIFEETEIFFGTLLNLIK